MKPIEFHGRRLVVETNNELTKLLYILESPHSRRLAQIISVYSVISTR